MVKKVSDMNDGNLKTKRAGRGGMRGKKQSAAGDGDGDGGGV